MTIPGTAPVQLLLRPRDSTAGWARRILVGLVACAAACAVSITFLDRPIAVAVHALIRQPGSVTGRLIGNLTHTPDLHILLALVLLIAIGVTKLWRRLRGTGRRRSGAADPADVVFLASSAVVVGEVTKGVLKYAFGRTWPETWVHHNPSFIRDGVYGFFPFHGGAAYGSFPSGHTAAVCAATTVLWRLWPRGRPLYALAVVIACVGLLGMNLHFLSDIMAGAVLGWAVGQVVVRFGSSA